MKLFDNLRAWYSPLISPADRAEWAHAGGGIPSAHDVETHQEVIDIFFGAYGHPDALTDRILALGFDVVDFRWVTSCIRKGELVPVEQYCFNYLSGKLTYGLEQDSGPDDEDDENEADSDEVQGLLVSHAHESPTRLPYAPFQPSRLSQVTRFSSSSSSLPSSASPARNSPPRTQPNRNINTHPTPTPTPSPPHERVPSSLQRASPPRRAHPSPAPSPSHSGSKPKDLFTEAGVEAGHSSSHSHEGGPGQDNDDDDSGFSSAGGSEDQPGLFGRSKRARDEKGGQEDEERVTSRRRPSEGEEKDKAATPPPADPAIKVEERSTSPLHFFSPPPATFSDPLSHFFASLRLPDHHPASPPTFSIQDLLAQFPSVLPAFEGLEGQDRSVALRRGLWTVEHGKDGFRAERVRKEERKSEVSA